MSLNTKLGTYYYYYATPPFDFDEMEETYSVTHGESQGES